MQLKPWVNNHSNNMEITTNKSPLSQQWGKKLNLYQTSTKWRMQERSSAREAGSIPGKMVILEAQAE